jgi:chemotaxis signal transduction protein
MANTSSLSSLSSLRSRRMVDKQVQATQQFIAFRLRAAWFVLPVTALYRVIQLESNTLPKVTLAGALIQIVDLGKLLFGKDAIKPAPPLIIEGSQVADRPCLILVQNSEGKLVSLPSNSQPVLIRLSADQFSPLPESQQWNLDIIENMIEESPDRPALFEIKPNRLVAIALN